MDIVSIKVPYEVRKQIFRIVDLFHITWREEDVEQIFDELLPELKKLLSKVRLPNNILTVLHEWDDKKYIAVLGLANSEYLENVYVFSSSEFYKYTLPSDIIKDLMKKSKRIFNFIMDQITETFEETYRDLEDEEEIKAKFQKYVQRSLDDEDYCNYLLKQLGENGEIILVTYKKLKNYYHLPFETIEEVLEYDLTEILDEDVYYMIRKKLTIEELFKLDMVINDYQESVIKEYEFLAKPTEQFLVYDVK